MLFTEHYSQEHIDLLIAETEDQKPFEKQFKVLMSDKPLEDKLQEIAKNKKLSELLDEKVRYMDFAFLKLITTPGKHELIMEVKKPEHKTFDIYQLHFVPDYRGYDKKMEQAKKDLAQLEADAQLFDEGKKADEKALKQRIADLESDKETFLAENKPFKTPAELSKFENKGGKKKMTFLIPMESALLITEDSKLVSANYRIVLNPLND